MSHLFLGQDIYFGGNAYGANALALCYVAIVCLSVVVFVIFLQRMTVSQIGTQYRKAFVAGLFGGLLASNSFTMLLLRPALHKDSLMVFWLASYFFVGFALFAIPARLFSRIKDKLIGTDKAN